MPQCHPKLQRAGSITKRRVPMLELRRAFFQFMQ